MKRTDILGAAVFLLAMAAMSFTPAFAGDGPVARYGRLFADGNRIVGEHSGGEAVQLKGPSFYWSHSNWGGRHFFITDAVDAMIDGWKAQVIRFPLGINENPDARDDGGYDTDPQGNWERLKFVTDHAISRGVYVVVDWHAHNAHTPENTARAIEFFTNDTLAGKWGNNPAVIFEIYNEPIGAAATWATQVKPYSEAVIGAIRAKGFDNLIIVGNPTWSSRPDIPADDPPVDSEGKPFENMAMSFHFYARAHQLNSNHWAVGKSYRQLILDVLDRNFPVFVSEWGTNDASDTIPYAFDQTDLWHHFLDSLKISSCAWSAAVVGNALDYWNGWSNPLNLGPGVLANWTNPDNMTPHGRYIYRWLTGDSTIVLESDDGWPAFAGLRSQIPLVSTGNWNVGVPNTTTTLDWGVTDDGILNMKFKLDRGTLTHEPYAGIGLVGDVSRCEWGIGYTYRGSKHTLRPEQSDVNGENGWDYHYNTKPTGAAEDWTTVRIPWEYFQQFGWGNPPVPQDVTKVTTLRWYVGFMEASSGDEGEIWVRDVWCLGDPDGEVVSVRPSANNRPAVSAGQSVRMSGRVLQVRLAHDGKIDIFDLKGARVRTIELRQGDHAIRMNDLPRGAYVVRASAGSWNRSVRMLLK
ncbi:MAG: glycoside hydrolase family 5 protein [Chitinispirillales bacterium]|jgi:endoglucanase|nr:glycoside hydrolase family 5 protein [Chitinispirillales bacterium]